MQILYEIFENLTYDLVENLDRRNCSFTSKASGILTSRKANNPFPTIKRAFCNDFGKLDLWLARYVLAVVATRLKLSWLAYDTVLVILS